MLDTLMNVTYEAGYLMPFFLILKHKRVQVFGFRCYDRVMIRVAVYSPKIVILVTV